MTLTEADADRFWSKVQKSDGCWEWTASRKRFGYGQFQLGRRPYAAHRLAYEIAHGPIPDGLVIRHKCDNPPCVRPDHLETGTRKDNSRDTIARGRYNPASGDAWITLRDAARLLGVDPATLRRQIHLGKLAGRRFRGSPWHVRRSEVERYARDHRGKLGPK